MTDTKILKKKVEFAPMDQWKLALTIGATLVSALGLGFGTSFTIVHAIKDDFSYEINRVISVQKESNTQILHELVKLRDVDNSLADMHHSDLKEIKHTHIKDIVSLKDLHINHLEVIRDSLHNHEKIGEHQRANFRLGILEGRVKELVGDINKLNLKSNKYELEND